MAEIKGVIFDLGGVIASHGTLAQEAGFIGKELGVSEEDALNAIKESNYLPAELGQEPSLEFWRRILQKLNMHHTDEATLASMRLWVEKVSMISQSMIDLVGELRKQYKVGLLSNTSMEYVEALGKNGFFEHFDDVILSYEVGLRKPDPAIYKLAAERLGILPEQLIFVDDLNVNIDGAEKCGIHGIVFRNIDQLKKDLAQLSVMK
jgi:epoxide hydrolase-like predicted phosphatase